MKRAAMWICCSTTSDVLTKRKADPDLLYFHAIWTRQQRTELGRDFEILPQVHGEGRYLGAHVGVIIDHSNPGWWGEGEVKMYVDGDRDLPTIVGTGTEDYIGTGWGEGQFHTRYQGSLIADGKRGQYGFIAITCQTRFTSTRKSG